MAEIDPITNQPVTDPSAEPAIQGGPTETPIEPAPAPEPAPSPGGSTPPEPETVRVNVGGVYYEVDPTVAQALEQSAPAPAPIAPTPAPVTAPEPSGPLAGIADIETRIYSEPRQVLNEVYEQAKRDMSGLVTQQVQQKDAVDSFWAGFYKDNKDLADQDFVVKTIADQDAPLLKQLGADKYADHVATRARREILRIRGVQPAVGPDPRPTATPTIPQPAAPAPAQEQEPPPAIDFLRQRQRLKHGRGNG